MRQAASHDPLHLGRGRQVSPAHKESGEGGAAPLLCTAASKGDEGAAGDTGSEEKGEEEGESDDPDFDPNMIDSDSSIDSE